MNDMYLVPLIVVMKHVLLPNLFQTSNKFIKCIFNVIVYHIFILVA